MEDKVLPRQVCALAFGAFTVPAIAVLPRAGWLWATIASGAAGVLSCLLAALARKGKTGLVRAAGRSGIGRGMLWLLLGWNWLVLGASARWLCGIYPESEAFLLIGLLLLLLAAYAAGKGVSATVRAGAICFFFFVILYGILFGFSVPKMQKSWLEAQKTTEWSLLPAALLPVNAIYLAGHCRDRGSVLPWTVGGTAFAAIAAAATAGCLSPEIATAEKLPFYVMSKSISIFGTMERLEAVVSAALTAGGFCMLALLCLVNEEIVRTLLPSKRKMTPGANFLLGAAAAAALDERWMAALAVGTTIFWGLEPVALLFVGRIKKE